MSASTPTAPRVDAVLRRHPVAVFPGVYDTLSAKLAPGRVRAGVHFGLRGLGHLYWRARPRATGRKPRRWARAREILPERQYPHHRRCRHRVRQRPERGADGRGADRGRSGRCFLEDQVWPKRCGHMAGKQVVPRNDYLEKIDAAVETRGPRDFFIVARTDALAVSGLDEAVARVEAARSAGANATFIEAPPSIEQLAEVGRRAPKPTVCNMVERGRTPLLREASSASWDSSSFSTRSPASTPLRMPSRRSMRSFATSVRPLTLHPGSWTSRPSTR